MTDMIGVRLTPENQSALTTLQEQEPVVIDEIVNRALSSYFFALKFDAFRARLIKPPEGQPVYTEEEFVSIVG